MENLTTLHSYDDIYWGETPLNTIDLDNKLLCTFVDQENLDALLSNIISSYSIKYNKIFVLHIKSTGEYALTYNVDHGNVSHIPTNTILVHRNKASNTLYTINALNELIKSLNGGVVDTSYRISWQHYKNSILLTQEGQFKQLGTKIHEIVEI